MCAQSFHIAAEGGDKLGITHNDKQQKVTNGVLTNRTNWKLESRSEEKTRHQEQFYKENRIMSSKGYLHCYVGPVISNSTIS